MNNQNDSSRLLVQLEQEMRKETQEVSKKEAEIHELEAEAETLKQAIFAEHKDEEIKKARQSEILRKLPRLKMEAQAAKFKIQKSHSELDRVKKSVNQLGHGFGH